MTTFTLKTVLFFSFFATLIGCSPVYYKPSLVNAPNFQKKGQTYLAAHSSLGLGSSVEGFGTTISNHSTSIGDIQAAYAFADHFAIQGNYESGDNQQTITYAPFFGTTTPTKKTRTEGALGECAVGYFRPLNESIALGLYGGYGSGWIDNNWNTDGASSAKLSKYFLQGTIGTIGKNAKRFEVIGSAKLARLNYYDLRQTYTNQGCIDAFNVLKSPLTVVEFGGVARLGFEHIKFQFQSSFIASSTITNPPFQYDGLSIGLGICVQLGGNKNEMKDEKKKKCEKKDKTYKYEFF
jgi:hypothetical protein